jgi:hypothetical protein
LLGCCDRKSIAVLLFPEFRLTASHKLLASLEYEFGVMVGVRTVFKMKVLLLPSGLYK